MNRVLIVAEHADGRLNAAVAKCVACARTIPDSEITVAVLAKDGGEVAAAAAALEGVARVLLVLDVGLKVATIGLTALGAFGGLERFEEKGFGWRLRIHPGSSPTPSSAAGCGHSRHASRSFQ